MKLKRLLPWIASGVFASLPMSLAAASEVDAAGYYNLRCASCHGVNGEGTRDKAPSLGPPLRGNPLVINAPVEILVAVIRHGRGGQQRVYDESFPNMPAFDAGMVPDAIGLANYLKTVLQRSEKATAISVPAPQLPDEDAVTPGDVAIQSDEGLVAPRYADDASKVELPAATSIAVFR